MTKVAFIGLGNMGMPMSVNLLKANYGIRAFDPMAAALEKAVAEGMTACASSSEAVADADVIITMLPNGGTVLEVFEEALSEAKTGAVIVDSSTIDMASACRAHEMARAAGLMSLDAPVSGGVGGAMAGTLTFMVGGARAALEKAKPVLDVMGGRLVHCGDAGTGQAAKMCNNMLLGISMVGVCEAFLLADKLGLSAESAFDVISTSSGFCWSVNTYCPVPGVGPQSPADNDYKPGFAAGHMLKDLKLSQDAADESAQATPMGHLAMRLYQDFFESGGSGRDFSGIIDYLKTVRRDASS